MNTAYASRTDAFPLPRRRRPSALAHGMVALCAWGLAVVVTMAVAEATKIGPVVFTLTRNHGLHAGDVYTALVMAVFATAVTVVVAARYWIAARR